MSNKKTKTRNCIALLGKNDDGTFKDLELLNFRNVIAVCVKSNNCVSIMTKGATLTHTGLPVETLKDIYDRYKQFLINKKWKFIEYDGYIFRTARIFYVEIDTERIKVSWGNTYVEIYDSVEQLYKIYEEIIDKGRFFGA